MCFYDFDLKEKKIETRGVGSFKFQFHEDLYVTKQSIINDINYQFVLSEKKPAVLEKGKIYVEKISDKETHYHLLDDKLKPQTGVLSSEYDEAIKDMLKRHPLDLSPQGPLVREILQNASLNGHIHPIFVETSHASKGPFLVSEGFANCQAVVAELKNGEYAVYHAENAVREVPGFQSLIRLIQGQVKDVYIFEKVSAKHRDKGPVLALELSDCLGGLEVKRIPLDQYASVLVDSVNKKVIFANKFHFIDTRDEFKEIKGSAIEIDMTKAIPLRQSIADLVASKTKVYKIPPRFRSIEQEVKAALVSRAAPPASPASGPAAPPSATKHETKVILREEEKAEIASIVGLDELKTEIKAKLQRLRFPSGFKQKLRNTLFDQSIKINVLKLCLAELNLKPPAKPDKERLIAALGFDYIQLNEGTAFKLLNRTLKMIDTINSADKKKSPTP
ncbi:MAG: P1/P2 acidic ribosomal protein [Gammaproteobacteria bacterium]